MYWVLSVTCANKKKEKRSARKSGWVLDLASSDATASSGSPFRPLPFRQAAAAAILLKPATSRMLRSRRPPGFLIVPRTTAAN